MLLYLLVFIYSSYSQDIKCNPGCPYSNCLTNYTCKTSCGPNYDNDNTCDHCKFTDPYNENIPIYFPDKLELVCKEFNHLHKRAGSTFLPEDSSFLIIELNKEITFRLDEDTSDIDNSFCYYRQKFRVGQWLKMNMSQVTHDHLVITIKKTFNESAEFYLDGTKSQYDTLMPTCDVHTTLGFSEYSSVLKFPVLNPYKNTEKDGDSFEYYFFANLRGLSPVTMTLIFTEEQGKNWEPYLRLNQTFSDTLLNSLGTSVDFVIPFESTGIFTYPACMRNKYSKIVLFTVEYQGSYSLLLNGKSGNRVNYLSEYVETNDSVSGQTNNCVHLWSGENYGINSEISNYGFLAKINGTVSGVRRFVIISEDYRAEITLKVSAICPDNCNAEKGYGYCVTSSGRCECADGYGGDSCIPKCYYNNQWTTSDNADLCYWGAPNCDQYCKCTGGKTVKNHMCLSSQCSAGKVGDTDECKGNTEGCFESCTCMKYIGFYPTTNQMCKHELCGNGIKDTYYDNKHNIIRTEDCDNGTYCDSFCRCYEGYIPDPNDNTSCIKKSLSGGAIAGIAISGTTVVVILLVIMVIIVIASTRYKKVDINIFKTQQPQYHYYIGGARKMNGDKKNGFVIDPINLDFGNATNATAIYDTRYQKIEVTNYSRNKYLMIIFHTPNSPKFIFHFDPQVLYIPPSFNGKNMKIMTCYFTLFCTTKVRNMKIPYTVWMSKNRNTLVQISELLHNKTFEGWIEEDQKRIEHLCRNVQRRYYNTITIETDATSSTYIDMDELNMNETPIAEGAMGKVFIGNYRSVPVAIKQFKWENLSDDEMKELKNSVIAECEMMSKLRNPFIANYMGSVTYLPQVSMVIQFFVLGALGEYLRDTKEDFLRLPYKLKVRMLFDTARGMEFLHENKIMHLDLKPDNLLVNSLDFNSACTIKITDFGTSRFTKKSINNSDDKGLGTPIYAAPETFQDVYTNAGDVYSFAITAWELFYQEEPYMHFKSIFEIKKSVQEGKRLEIDQKMPVLYRKLVEQCWKQNGCERPTFDLITKSLVKIDEDVMYRQDLDERVELYKLSDTITQRNAKLHKILEEMSRD
ncbi:serine-threonine protein kinase, putative [Entamoeba invadens IP1]|uniref:Serine-threonine protein kinase, putative n=1 Tax=Entamoeba invadens IP1 TaxID=370355 RepID=A0A0A1UA60_ENTIV|nr:serine-threonine protein kinase, putative [Entamoeba invadens IP1]ELP89029.1 serine-threonine protein kinase, putative [Entamoeba invadens IP1]|eukprot:XP_004255800.1 serine-threonine protein kinase, putative [Entamoeba invadens IP1]